MIQNICNMIIGLTPSAGGVYESARLNDNLDGTGGITVSWSATEYVVLPVGTSVTIGGTKYMLLDPYSPTKSSYNVYRYEPTFLHPLARLSRVPFYITSRDVGSNRIQLSTSSFTGLARTIAQKLATFFYEYGATDEEFKETFGVTSTDAWTAEIGTTDSLVITVDFDGCSIRAAATRIADAMGCNVFFDWAQKKIRFIFGTTLDGEYYNCFHVLGGTTNMAKQTVSGVYGAVIQRLQLPETYEGETYEGSIIDTRAEGSNEPRLTTDIILDDIYPKIELIVASVMPRVCYLTDEEGNHIPETTAIVDGQTVVTSWKKYTKWYVSLRYNDENETPYVHNTGIQIADKPLCMLFQPDYENTSTTCPLAGRQFEVVYYDNPNGTREWDKDDAEYTESVPFEAPFGWFRIIFTAEGNTIIPTNVTEQLVPQVGNKVTLVNIAAESVTTPTGNVNFKTIAQQELLKAAKEIIAFQRADGNEYHGTVIGNIPTIGTSGYEVDGHTGVVTNINADLDTGVADVTIGSWKRKTLTGGIRDKIDAISITTKGGDTNNNTSPVSKNQFDALWKTTKKPTIDTTAIDALGADVEAIKAQEDSKFYIIFGRGVPTNQNEPAATWITNGEEEVHVQDIYFNTNREGASQGGRAYRWMKIGTNGGTVDYSNGVPVEYNGGTHDGFVYMWVQITDMDTNASLEKIADVASDSILSGGAEKTRIFIEWKNAKEQYENILSEHTTSNFLVDITNFEKSYWALWAFLNGDNVFSSGTLVLPSSAPSNLSNTPSWLVDLSSDTRLSDVGRTAEQYRTVWNNFYAELSAITSAMTGEGRTIVGSKTAFFVSDTPPTPPYEVGDMWLKPPSDLYECIYSKAQGVLPSESDWQKRSSFGVSLSSMLADFCSRIEERLTEYDLKNLNVIHVYVQSTDPGTTNSNEKYIWLNIGESPIKLLIGGSEYRDLATAKLLLEIYSILGDVYASSTYLFTVYKTQFPSDSRQFDVCMIRSSFTDSFTGKTIDGSLGVWVRGETEWIKVLDNTTGVMQNYGDAIVNAVFGNEALPEGVESYAAGLVTQMNYSTMFAKAIDDATGETTALAAISTIIEREEGTNKPTGKILLTADQINIDASDLNLRAEDITFTSGGNTFTLQNGLVSLFLDNLSGSDGQSKTSALQTQLGMVIRSDGSNGVFSFGTFVNNQFQAGLNFKTEVVDTTTTRTKLLLTSDTAKIDADALVFSGKTIDMTGASSINLNTPLLSLDADKIKWKGLDIIKAGNNVSKFSVDNNGNLAINGLTAQNASIFGTMNGTFLKVTRTADVSEFISRGDDGCYTRIVKGKLEIGRWYVENNEEIFVPSYRTVMINNGQVAYPILEYIKPNGTTNRLAGDEGSGVTVPSSWNSEKLIPCNTKPTTLTDVSNEETTLYQFVAGYTVQDGIREYNSGEESDNGKWFTTQSRSAYANGYYVKTSGYFVYETANDGVEYARECRNGYRFVNGVVDEEYIVKADDAEPTGRGQNSGGEIPVVPFMEDGEQIEEP